MPPFSCSELVMLVESALGNAGMIDDITIKPLESDSWLVTGFLHSLRDTSQFPASHIQLSGIYSGGARSSTRSLHSNTASVVAVDSEEGPRSNKEDDDLSDCDLGYGDGDN